jgi:hypothetical protein
MERKPKVLVACEESQAVTIEMRRVGVEAYSCDIIDCSGGHPEWHIKWDALALINGNCSFMTCDGQLHHIDGPWDLLIAHPPCTFLTGAGACNIPKHPERIEQGFEAAEFFKKILDANCEKIAVENPPPMKRFNLPKYSQITRPWMFGDSNNKAICFWLKGLKELRETNVVEKDKDMVRWIHKATGQKKSCSKWYNTNTSDHNRHRSKTFPGIAKAMAEQWGATL